MFVYPDEDVSVYGFGGVEGGFVMYNSLSNRVGQKYIQDV